MNRVIETITSRVSCRSYNEKKVPLSKLNQILEAGKYAPSGMNRQICNILVVRSKGKVEKIREALIKKFNRDCLYGANTVAIVYGKKDEPLMVQDASCILENMFIAATALKIDSCWINQFEQLLTDPDYVKLRKSLGFTENDKIVGSAIFGYHKEEAKLEVKPRKEDFIKVI